jgi:hypothetical protein
MNPVPNKKPIGNTSSIYLNKKNKEDDIKVKNQKTIIRSTSTTTTKVEPAKKKLKIEQEEKKENDKVNKTSNIKIIKSKIDASNDKKLVSVSARIQKATNSSMLKNTKSKHIQFSNLL